MKDWAKYWGVILAVVTAIFGYGKLQSDVRNDKINTDIKLQYQSNDIKEIKGDIKEIKNLIFSIASRKR